MALQVYTPEMNEAKPVAQIEARLAHYGQHYFIDTPLTLKGQGVRFIDTYKASELTEKGQRKAGWNRYKVTDRAFKKICAAHDVSYEMLLD